MTDVFVSYARKDRDFVGKLVDAIKSQGWMVWWDPALIAGQRFDQAIREALAEAKCVVVVWSPNSIDSQWVQDEAGVGRDRHALIPVTIDGATSPLGFRQLQTVDLTDWDPGTEDDRLKDLLLGVRSLVEGGLPPGAVWPSRSLPRPTFWSRNWKILAATAATLVFAAVGLNAIAPNILSSISHLFVSRSFEIYDGYGIFDESSRLDSAADWQECQAKCKVTADCSAFTYFKERHACFLLASYQDVRSDARTISAVLSQLEQQRLNTDQ